MALLLLALVLGIGAPGTMCQTSSSQSTATAVASGGTSATATAVVSISGPPPRPKATAPPEFPTPMCSPRDFNSIVEKECGDKKHLPPRLKDRPPPRSREECEAAVTARELQKAILTAEPNCVAQILIQSNSVKGIEEGFRISPDFNFVPNPGFRELDPDVVALKGLVLGVLQGDRDDKLVRKLVNGIVPSLTERPGTEPEPKKPVPPPKKTPPAEGETTVSCKSAVTTTATDNTFSSSEVKSCKETTSLVEPEPRPVLQEINRTRFEESLRDRRLLRDVFNTDPNEPNVLSQELSLPGEVGRRLLERPTRKLQCSSCENADGYVCSFCWEADFCSQFYWCPPNV